MKKKTVLVFVFDGMADWEPSYALVGINKSDGYNVRTIALEKSIKKTMGGMSVWPDLDFRPQTDLKDLDASNTALLILPGGTAWDENRNEGIAELALHCVRNQIPIAAICAATHFLADLGILDQVRHTGNALEQLQATVRTYAGANLYQHEAVVSERGIVTAGGAAPIEFAQAIFELLEIAENEEVRSWFNYFQNKVAEINYSG